MTKEDALFFLARFRTKGINEKLYDALGVAIEALNAQPSAADTNVVITDTISRQDAINAICEDGTALERQGRYRLTMAERKQRDADILDALPSAQPTDEDIQRMQDIEQAALEKAYECGKQDAMQWIPCEERLPEPGVNVLVDVLDIPADDRFPLVDKIGDDGDWCNCYGEWLAVAWVPIPDPWEGENDG